MIITKFTSLLLLPLVARAHITLESISSVSVASLASVGGSGYTGAPPPSDTYAPSPGGSDSPTVPAPSPTAPPASPTGSVTATTPRPSSSGGAIDPGRRLKNVTIAANDPRIILSPPEAWTPTPGNICATGGVTNNTLNTTLTTTTPQSFVAFNFTGLALFVNIVSTRQTGVCNMVLDGVDVDGDPNTDGLNTSEQPACVPALARGEGTQYAMDYGAHGLVMTIVGSSPKPESLGGSEVQLDSITYTTYEDEDPSSGGSGGSAPAGAPSASTSPGGGSNGAKENLAVGFLGVWAVTFALFALL